MKVGSEAGGSQGPSDELGEGPTGCRWPCGWEGPGAKGRGQISSILSEGAWRCCVLDGAGVRVLTPAGCLCGLFQQQQQGSTALPGKAFRHVAPLRLPSPSASLPLNSVPWPLSVRLPASGKVQSRLSRPPELRPTAASSLQTEALVPCDVFIHIPVCTETEPIRGP